MFEITPKEQLLKNIRKGLVQPLANKYPLLNFEKQVQKLPLIPSDENFIDSWTKAGFGFLLYNGLSDLAVQINSLIEQFELGEPYLEDQNLKNVFNEGEIVFKISDHNCKTIISGFSKLEAVTDSIYFSTETHPVKSFVSAEYIILFGKSSQTENPEQNKYFNELVLKNDLRVQITLDYFKKYKKVFLFIEE